MRQINKKFAENVFKVKKILLNNQPDYALIFSWYYGINIIKNLKKRGYKEKFILPLPCPRITN